MNRPLASAFSEFASGLSHASVPDHVREAALWHIVDTIGVSIAGADPHEESGQAAQRLAKKWQATSGATVLGIGMACRAEASALINGALAQALEMDDKHGSSLARPGSTVVPAVLAVAQEHDRPLEDVITAVVVGYEVMIRLGFVAGERFLERGYHTSSLLGAFGTAAAVGRLLECRPDEIADGLGIAGTFSSGIQEATRTGSTSKILHGGWGAHAGIVAMDLAMAGITGPASVFEGEYGFFRSHLTPIAGELDWVKPAESLGGTWYLHETAYKPYPCCQLLHAFIEAGKQLRVELARDGVDLRAIDRISCFLAEPGLALVTEPKDRKSAPQHPHEARFSLPFTVATTLLEGDVGLETFRPARLGSSEIRRLAALVRSAEDPDSDYPLHCPAILEIEVAGKSYRRHVPFHPGSPEAPLSHDDVLDKFARNTSWLFADRARDLGASLAALPESQSLGAVFRRLEQAGDRLVSETM